MKRKAVVAMSGGVDSSVAAALMKQDGWEVIGLMLKLWQGAAANNESGCCSLDAAEDARRVAQVLDIPFYVLNFADRFSDSVIANFVSSYRSGLTPNPCIECNRSIKFAALMDRAKAYDADVLVTGHYARVVNDGHHRLLKGVDPTKDQSYVLYMLDQRDLAKTRFPVGEYSKTEIRQIAHGLGLRTAAKAESQEICFVPSGDSHAFLQQSLPEGSEPGQVVGTDGAVLGEHRGFAHYTVGQRRGLGVSLGVPLYVRSVDSKTNTVVAAKADEMLVDSLEVKDVSFVSGAPPSQQVTVMCRYRGPEAACSLVPSEVGFTVGLAEPQMRPAPGQAAVFYDGDEVLGGGTIVSAS